MRKLAKVVAQGANCEYSNENSARVTARGRETGFPVTDPPRRVSSAADPANGREAHIMSHHQRR